MKKYYYCQQDSHGQRTGIVKEIEIDPNTVQTDRFGFKRYKGNFLYTDINEAERAALN